VDDHRRLEAKGLARAKARSRRLRAASIRSRTVRGSLALFAVLWGIVFVQLVSGNDPALSKSNKSKKGTTRATPAREQQAGREPAPEAEAETAPLEPEPEYEYEYDEYEPETGSEYEYEPEYEEPEPEYEEPEPAPVITGSS